MFPPAPHLHARTTGGVCADTDPAIMITLESAAHVPGKRLGQPGVSFSLVEDLGARLRQAQQAAYFAGAKPLQSLLAREDRLDQSEAHAVWNVASSLLQLSVESAETWVRLLAPAGPTLSSAERKR